MKKIIMKIIDIIDKYEISIIAASTSFYAIVALLSLLTLVIQFYNYFSTLEHNVLIQWINNYLNNSFVTDNDIIDVLSLNSFTPFIFLNLIWSSSKILTGFNKACDMIYDEVKKRNFVLIRFTSFLMFLLLISIFIMETLFILGVFRFLSDRIKINYSLLIFLFLIFAFLILLSIIVLLYLYCPPVLMNIKKVWFGSFLATIFVFFSSIIYVLIIDIYQKININFGIISFMSTFFFYIYIVNFILIIGIIINKKRNEQNRNNGK